MIKWTSHPLAKPNVGSERSNFHLLLLPFLTSIWHMSADDANKSRCLLVRPHRKLTNLTHWLQTKTDSLTHWLTTTHVTTGHSTTGQTNTCKRHDWPQYDMWTTNHCRWENEILLQVCWVRNERALKRWRESCSRAKYLILEISSIFRIFLALFRKISIHFVVSW